MQVCNSCENAVQTALVVTTHTHARTRPVFELRDGTVTREIALVRSAGAALGPQAPTRCAAHSRLPGQGRFFL